MRSSEFLNEADPANPYTGKDPVKAAAWAKLSPQIQANIGGADPTDRFIIQAMASGSSFGRSKGINDANPDGTPKVAAAPAAPAAPAAVPVAAAPVKTAGTGYGDDDTSVFAAPAAPAATPVADAVAASGEPDNVTGVDAAVAANAANTANTVQATTPPAKAPARSTISPAILGYASSMGLYKNGQPDTAAIKAFQQKNGLPADGKIGPNTSGAILSAAKPGDAGSGRGGAGGPSATQVTQNATPAGTVPPRPGIGFAKAGEQAAWDRQYGATHNTNGTPKGAVRESNFEESVSRMRRLSTLLKG
jgi:hypothetical protein